MTKKNSSLQAKISLFHFAKTNSRKIVLQIYLKKEVRQQEIMLDEISVKTEYTIHLEYRACNKNL